MTKHLVVVFCSLSMCLTSSAWVFAQDKLPVEGKSTTSKDKPPSQEQVPPQGQANALSDCIARSLPITDGGHRWNIDATNNCGRGWACDFSLTLRTNTGLNTSGSCSAFVPQNAVNLRICSHFDSTLTWVAVTSNGYQCHY